MKKYAFLILIAGIIISCNKKDVLLNDCIDSIFYYDSLNGECVNCKGELGLNPYNLNQIRLTKNAECMKFPAMHLVFILDTLNIENFNEYANNDIQEYNFKGADLDSTNLHFNQLIKSNFEGAKISQINFGYARINGEIDSYTEYPEGCIIENDSINCHQ
jgi:hypothetical protein